MKRLGLVAALVVAALLFWLFHLERYLSLEYVRASQGKLTALYAQHRLLVIGSYFLRWARKLCTVL